MQTYEEGAQAAENGRESLERKEESRLEGLESENEREIYFEMFNRKLNEMFGN